MSRLEAAFQETAAALELERSKKASQRVRLLANPLIGVAQIQTTLEAYTRYCKSSDLYSLISPPACLAVVTWQTPPSGPWLSKVAPLLYDVLDFCPNTKLQHSKLFKALTSMQLNHSLEIQPRMTAQDAMDKISLSLRIVLSMLRTVKTHEGHKNRVMRSLSNEEQTKLNMVLKKVVLPVGYMEDQEKIEEAEECQVQQLDLQPCLALVPVQEPPETKEAKTQPAVQSPATAVARFLPAFLRPLPPIFSKILNKPAESSLAADAVQSQPKSASHKNQTLRDEDLLNAAMTHAPKEMKAQAKKKPAKNSGKKKAKKQNSKKKQMGTGKPSRQSKDANTPEDKKEKTTENRDPAPDVPMYHVQENPTEADGYRNLYVSRHHNRAKCLALKGGLSVEEAKERGRLAAQQASALWTEFRS
eukprot:s2492_g6.t1